jgi:hypothetical protein
MTFLIIHIYKKIINIYLILYIIFKFKFIDNLIKSRVVILN